MATSASPFDYLTSYPSITPEEEALERSILSEEEKLLAFADVYGQATDELKDLRELDRQLSLLPVSRKGPVHRGYTVRQARAFLRIEDNNPKKAAGRLARYWELRERQLGEAAFKAEHTTARTEDDYRRVFDMAQGAAVDECVDGETRKWAKNFIDQWNNAHIMNLEEELALIAPEQKVAFLEAEHLESCVAVSHEHKLLFLQCEDFDAKRAARRMVSYWDLRLDLFGPCTSQNCEGIGRSGAFCPKTVEDLAEECPRELDLNFFQVLPGTDNYGRTLFCFWPGIVLDGGYEIKNLLKIMWHVFHAALQDSNENGAILIVILKDHPNPSQIRSWWSITSALMRLLLESAPVFFRAVHDCAPPAPWFHKFFSPVLKWYMGKRLRIRYWVHAGETDEQNMLELESCGISREFVPAAIGGNLDWDSAGKEWLKRRKLTEC